MAENKKLDIKKGNKYRCFNIEYNFFMTTLKIIKFTVGNIYLSHKDGYLRNDDGIEMTFFNDAAMFFIHVEEDKLHSGKKKTV